MDVPGFMGMALGMSEINNKLNALSQQNKDSLSMSAPLRAAVVKPLPKSRTPQWLAAGFCIAAMAGGIGWWLGSQSEAAGTVAPVPQQSSELPQPQVVPSAEQPKAEPEAVVPEPEKTAGLNAAAVPEASPQGAKAASEPDAVKPVAKPVPVLKTEAKKAELKSAVVKNTGNNKQAVRASEPSKATHQPKPVEEKATAQKITDTQSVDYPGDAGQTEGLSIETVELDAGQLARVEYQKAKKALKSGDSRKAIGYLEAALKYQPEWVKARQKLSALYYGRGETRRAVAALQQGLALDSEQPDLRLTMAKLLVNESQQQAALNVLSQLPAQGHSEYLAMRGALAQQLNNNDMAISSYRLLVKQQPYDGRWWMGLGIALERSEAAEKAMDAYRQALLMGRVSQQSQQFIQQRLAVLEAREG